MAASASGQWTLGVLVGLPIDLFIGLVLLVAAIGAAWYWVHEEGAKSLALTVPAGVLALAVWAAVSILCFWPFKAEYHQYRPVSGTVASVSSRLISAGDKGGSDQKFVVKLTDSDKPYGITDTRASLLKPGDHVSLRCIRVYEYGSDSAGYDCKWGSG